MEKCAGFRGCCPARLRRRCGPVIPDDGRSGRHSRRYRGGEARMGNSFAVLYQPPLYGAGRLPLRCAADSRAGPNFYKQPTAPVEGCAGVERAGLTTNPARQEREITVKFRIIGAETWRMNQQQLTAQQAENLRLREALAEAERIAAGRQVALAEAHAQIAALVAERAEAAQVILALSYRVFIANATPTGEAGQKLYFAVRLADGSIAGPFSRS